MGLTVTALAKNADPMDLIENISYTRWEQIVSYVLEHFVPFDVDQDSFDAISALYAIGGDPVVLRAQEARLVGRFLLSAVPRDLPSDSDPVRGTVWFLGRCLTGLGDDCAIEFG